MRTPKPGPHFRPRTCWCGNQIESEGKYCDGCIAEGYRDDHRHKVLVKEDNLTTDGPTNRVAVKFDGQKLRYDLIPVMPLEELAKVYTFGAIKHGDRNWEKGFNWCRCLAAAMRHLFEFCKGKDIDDGPGGSGCHHLSAVAFYCFALIEFGRTHPGLDDRVKLK